MKKKGFGKKIILTAVLGLLCGGLAAGGLTAYSYMREQKEEKASETKKKQEADVLQSDKDASVMNQAIENTEEERVASVYDVSVIWDNAIPSMVEIYTKSVTSYYFFGREYKEENESCGTGVIIAQSEELFVVTNAHVVEGATAIELSFVDGSKAPAEIKGANAEEDIAVLSVKFSDLSEETLRNIKVITIGDSDRLLGGEMVIAIGNAAGNGQSLTVGYVSAVNREVEIEGVSMNLIQTDAEINPGNSGGALLNARGELIGINNAKLVASDVEGIGYAIPISEVISIINQMLNREEIEYEKSAVLGITCRDVTENLSEALSMPIGIYIAEIEEGSAAQKAGLPLYGVITEVNGITVKTEEQLLDVLRYIRGGTKGTVTVKERVRGEYVSKEYTVTFGVRGKENRER